MDRTSSPFSYCVLLYGSVSQGLETTIFWFAEMDINRGLDFPIYTGIYGGTES